jgi:hypothetical protein
MDCPRCGFQQPQDEYCAQCGINISQALSRRQRKNLLALLATFLALVVAGLYLIVWISREPTEYVAPKAGGSGTKTAHEALEPAAPELPLLPDEAEKSIPPDNARDEDLASVSAEPKPETPISPAPESEDHQIPTIPPLPEPQTLQSSPDDAPLEADPERQIRRWAAQEWFYKGQELGDYSEEELGFYQKALEVDPQFALAQYYSGLIYWEWGDQETAIEVFRQFWRDATQEERELYLLPEGLSQDELELSEQTE